MWIIEKKIRNGKYNRVLVRNHPKSNKYGYVLEHRVIMENHINRLLTNDEVVHHINNNSKDNRIENLLLMTIDEHNKYHGLKKIKKMVKLECPICKKIFIRERYQTHLSKKKNTATFCSRSCSGKYSNLKNKISLKNNVIDEYILKK